MRYWLDIAREVTTSFVRAKDRTYTTVSAAEDRRIRLPGAELALCRCVSKHATEYDPMPDDLLGYEAIRVVNDVSYLHALACMPMLQSSQPPVRSFSVLGVSRLSLKRVDPDVPPGPYFTRSSMSGCRYTSICSGSLGPGMIAIIFAKRLLLRCWCGRSPLLQESNLCKSLA